MMMPPFPPSPPATLPSPPPLTAPQALLIADGVTWAALLAGAIVLTAAVGLMFTDGRIGVYCHSRRLLLGRMLRAFAVVCLASACLPYYAEARFSVFDSSEIAGTNNPFVRLWNHAPAKHALHFGLWVYITFAFASAGVALAAAELLDRRQSGAAAGGQSLRRLRWHLNNSKGSLALAFVLLYSSAIVVTKSCDWLGRRYHWGAGWDVQEHGYTFALKIFDDSVFYAAYGGLVPMTLLGIPLGRTSAMWRAAGRSYEDAIAFHRALGHFMMAMYTYHGVGYMVYWMIRGIEIFAREMSDWFHCGKCTHINNLAGVISWAAGFLLWMTSLKWARRKNYALFFTTHQLHLVFFGFGCIHWPTLLAYAAPSIVFYAADLMLRRHNSRQGVAAIARVRPSLASPALTTLVIARSGDAPTAPRPAACPHGALATRRGGTCPAKGDLARAETEDDGEGWSGGCFYLAVPTLGRLPYLQWHPFSIGGSADGGASLIVHVRRCDGWTKRLATLAAAAPATRGHETGSHGGSSLHEGSSRGPSPRGHGLRPAIDPAADAEAAGAAEDGGDRPMCVSVIGPMPAPPALLDCVSEARSAVPLLLLGGGSGIVPLVAILRRLAYGGPPLPASAHVHLVLVAREACALEQLLDGRFLPRDAEGSTSYAWLRTEIYLTAGQPQPPPSPPDVEQEGKAPATSLAPLIGPFLAGVDDDGQIRATASPFASLDGRHVGRTGVPIQVYEGASLLGAALGFTMAAWLMVWRSDDAPWARRNAPTATTGGGGFLLALAAACACADLLLRTCDGVSLSSHHCRDGVSRLRAWLRRGARAKAIIRARPVEVVGGGGMGRRSYTDGVALSCAPSVSFSSSSSFPSPPSEPSAKSVTVPLAGRARPDAGKLLRSTHSGARVAVGGPPSMVDALDKALREAGRSPSVRLTTQM